MIDILWMLKPLGLSLARKTGAMGETLASFSLQSDAQAFAKEFGGKVLSFKDIVQDALW